MGEIQKSESFLTARSLPVESIQDPEQPSDVTLTPLDASKTSKTPKIRKLSGISDLHGDTCNTTDRLSTHIASTDFVTEQQDTEESQRVECARRKIDGKVGFECDKCSKIIMTKLGFLRHLRVHSGTRPCTCEICGKTYRISQDLIRHIRDVHDLVKNYTCDICQRSFANKGTRDDHRRIHTGERPYKCEHCPKTFKTFNSIYVHKRVHADYKPHKCETCGQFFRNKQRLNHHITTHTGVKAFACEICGKSFSVKSDVTRHKSMHDDEKRFSCWVCDVRFAQKRYLKNHIKVHHGEITDEVLKSLDVIK